MPRFIPLNPLEQLMVLGIRFVLFLQGCHLQCKYCHNRDTWDIKEGNYKSLDDIFDKIMRYKNYICPNRWRNSYWRRASFAG